MNHEKSCPYYIEWVGNIRRGTAFVIGEEPICTCPIEKTPSPAENPVLKVDCSEALTKVLKETVVPFLAKQLKETKFIQKNGILYCAECGVEAKAKPQKPMEDCDCGMIIMGNTLKHRKDCALNRVEKPVEQQKALPVSEDWENGQKAQPVEECCEKCDGTVSSSDGSSYKTCANKVLSYSVCSCHKKAENKADWEAILHFEIMEDYIITAELGHLAKDQLLHKQEMRGHYEKLKSFVTQTILSERKALKDKIQVWVDVNEKPPHAPCSVNFCSVPAWNEGYNKALDDLLEFIEK